MDFLVVILHSAIQHTLVKLFHYGLLLCIVSCSSPREKLVVDQDGNVLSRRLFTSVTDTSTYEEFRYFSAGHVRVHFSQLNGVKHGLFEEYFENGQMALQVTFKNGKEEGTWNAWYQDGSTKMVGESKAGKYLNVKEYYPNGQLAYDMQYAPAGKKTGPVTYYHADGSKQMHAEHQADQPTGQWSYWDDAGVLYKEETYERGQLANQRLILDEEFVRLEEGTDLVELSRIRLNKVSFGDTLLHITYNNIDSAGKTAVQQEALYLYLDPAVLSKHEDERGKHTELYYIGAETFGESMTVHKFYAEHSRRNSACYFIHEELGILAVFHKKRKSKNSIREQVQVNQPQYHKLLTQLRTALQQDTTHFFEYTRLRY